ncbi:MAG TPA: thiamine diphosphokinase [Peptococcaceae bacterium]|nr:thiamine diphosphokinase [Peptococcaceae bacterium]
MQVAVIANGEWDLEWGREELRNRPIDILIAADGGGDLALKVGRIPDVLIGDLDSISEESFKICQNNNTKIKKFPKEKDETDLELALEFAETYLQAYGRQEDEILLYAAGGKRLDHLLGNIALLLGYGQKQRIIKMIDKNYQAWVMMPGTKIISGQRGQELSLLPLSEKALVNSQGLYYELKDLTLFQNSPRGISNVFTQDCVTITVREGIVLVVLRAKEQ